jgi:hypothetical protein
MDSVKKGAKNGADVLMGTPPVDNSKKNLQAMFAAAMTQDAGE